MVAKIVRIFAIVILSIILLNVILFAVFSIPAVQKWAANIALDKFRPKFGTKVELESIRIRLFNTVELGGIYVEDKQQDTLFYAGKIDVRVHALDLLKNRVTVHTAAIKDFTANVHRASPDDPFNFQFIIDAFAKEKDTTVVKKEKKPWRITANNVILKNGNLNYDILSIPQTPGQFNVAHIAVRNFDFKANADFMGMDKMQARVEHLSFYEKNAGLQLNELKAKVKGVDSLLISDGVSVDLNQSHIKILKADFDRGSKAFSLRAESNRVDPADINFFVPRFAHLDKPLAFEVDAQGALPRVEVKSLDFRYGSDTELHFSGWISNFKDLENSELHANLHDFFITQDDLQSLIRIGPPEFVSPDPLLAMGKLGMQMSADGRLGLFNYRGKMTTEQGDISLNGTGQITNQFKNMVFKGPVMANRIQVGEILGGTNPIGTTSISTNVRLSMVRDAGMKVEAEGLVESTSFKDYPYNDIYFDGVFTGNNVIADIRSESDRNKFDIFGDITFGDEMKFKLKGDVERFDLNPFVKVEKWKDPYVKITIDGDLTGTSIDDLAGNVVIDNISLADSNFFYNPGAIYLRASVDEKEGKKIEFLSSFFEGSITGDYYFSTIGAELMKALHPHLPSLIVQKEMKPQQQEAEPGKNNFRFDIQLQNTEDLSYALSLPFYNVEPATLSGRVDMSSDKPLVIDARLPRVMVGSNDIRETKLNLRDDDSSLGIDVTSYLVQDNGYVNLQLNSIAALDSLNNRISFEMKQNNSNSDGNMLINVGLYRDEEDQLGANIRIPPARINFNNKKIDFKDAFVAYRTEHISISNFGIKEQDMLLLGIDGVASKNKEDSIRIYFNNTELANILNAFDVTNFNGSINGDIHLRQALENPMIRTEKLRVENITVHGDTIGTLRINGDWDNTLSGLRLNAWLEDDRERSFEIKGFIPTGDDSPFPMDVSLAIDDFKLMAISPLTTSIFSELDGRLNSQIHVSGSLSEPVAEGWLAVNDGMMKVAFTNVTYHVTDTIEISKDNVGMRDLVIRDQNNHTATLNVSVSHSNFGRMIYKAGIKLNDFMVLNNANRTDQMAYGNLNLSGELNITGSPAGIFGSGNLSNSGRSNVTVMLPQTASAAEYKGIVYVSNKPSEPDSLAFLKKNKEEDGGVENVTPQGIPIVMALTVDVNPQLKAKVLLDPTTGNALELNGEGELNVNFNSRNTPSVLLYGDYVINSGKFHYNLQNLKTIEFNIRDGSRLTMEGNPLNTQFNVTAYRPVRADLAALSPTFKNELSNTRVPVDALLKIKGNLESMDLEFDVELPENTGDVQQRVKSFMPNEESRILQVVYLVTTGSFMPTGGTPDTGLGSSMMTNFAAGALSKGLDALFAGALKDNWSISTNLESVDGTLDNVRMGVDVSTRLMDNRLRISTNLSYGENNMNTSQQPFMGEFEVEYDLNTWLMLRAFSRANEQFYSRAPTKQGVGLMITREAKRLRDLFNFRFVGRKEED